MPDIQWIAVDCRLIVTINLASKPRSHGPIRFIIILIGPCDHDGSVYSNKQPAIHCITVYCAGNDTVTCLLHIQLNNVSTQVELDDLLDEERFSAIVNASGWPTTKRLTIRNKAEFLDGLVNQELLLKRGTQISAFGRGLEFLGVLSAIRSHWEELKPAFVHTETMLTAEVFCCAIKSPPPSRKTYDWFIQHLKECDICGM